jgi:hypothetical protein
MRFRLQLITVDEDGSERMHPVAELERDTTLRLETIGLTLAEGKQILKHLQEVVVEEQVETCVVHTGTARSAASRCPPKAIIRSNYRWFSATCRSEAHVFDVAPVAREIERSPSAPWPRSLRTAARIPDKNTVRDAGTSGIPFHLPFNS